MDTDLLRDHGVRLTPQRQLILDLLQECSGHVAPEEIYQRVHAHFPMVNRSTIYRTLDLFEELGVIRHTHDGDGAARYHLGHDSLHLHLFCHRCGKFDEVEDVSIADPLKKSLLERYGFVADPTHFAIAGLCAACAKSV